MALCLQGLTKVESFSTPYGEPNRGLAHDHECTACCMRMVPLGSNGIPQFAPSAHHRPRSLLPWRRCQPRFSLPVEQLRLACRWSRAGRMVCGGPPPF